MQRCTHSGLSPAASFGKEPVSFPRFPSQGSSRSLRRVPGTRSSPQKALAFRLKNVWSFRRIPKASPRPTRRVFTSRRKAKETPARSRRILDKKGKRFVHPSVVTLKHKTPSPRKDEETSTLINKKSLKRSLSHKPLQDGHRPLKPNTPKYWHVFLPGMVETTMKTARVTSPKPLNP